MDPQEERSKKSATSAPGTPHVTFAIAQYQHRAKRAVDRNKRDLSTRVGYENRIVAALHVSVRGEAPGDAIGRFDPIPQTGSLHALLAAFGVDEPVRPHIDILTLRAAVHA